MTWYAYGVSSQREIRVRDTVAEWGFGAAVPIEMRERKRSGLQRRTVVKRPLISGYVFIDIPADLGWWHVLDIRFIQKVIGIAGKPVEIDGDWIERVSREKDIIQSRINLPPGTEVEFVGGPADGHFAKVVEAEDEFIEICKDGWNFPMKVRRELLQKVG